MNIAMLKTNAFAAKLICEETGPDWNPGHEDKYYAHYEYEIGFGKDKETAMNNLLAALGMYTDTVENLRGQYVRRKIDAKKVYEVIGYCRINKRYELADESDISRSIFVKKGTKLFAGFTY